MIKSRSGRITLIQQKDLYLLTVKSEEGEDKIMLTREELDELRVFLFENKLNEASN